MARARDFSRVSGDARDATEVACPNHVELSSYFLDTALILWSRRGDGRFRFRCGEIARDDFVLETSLRVGAVTERFVLRLAAAAESDHLSASKTELVSLGIENFKIAFNADGAVVIDRNLRIGHEKPMLARGCFRQRSREMRRNTN